LVIVDDASTDATLSIAQRYASSDPRIKIYRNEQNLGIGKTRNHTLARATGRFITPLDSDDWYHPTRLERLLASADAFHAQVLADDLLVVRDGNHELPTRLSELCEEPLDQPMSVDMAGVLQRLGIERDGIAIGLTKPLIDRHFLLDHSIHYDTTLSVGEDYWMLADCVAAGATLVMIPEALYYYRLHAQQMTKATDPAQDLLSTRRRLEAFIDTDAAANDAAAMANARYHLRRMDVLASYASFTRSLKALRPDKAARDAFNEPKVLSEFATRLPLVIDRRRRARQGDPYAYDQLFARHRSRRVPVAHPAAVSSSVESH
jgi:hypothetical protein